jgi:hypothetical protein
VKLEAPSTATKICTGMISPVLASTTSPVWPAKSLADVILRSRPHPEQGFRSCIGILGLVKRYGTARVDAACARALVLGTRSYNSVATILKNPSRERTAADRRGNDPDPREHSRSRLLPLTQDIERREDADPIGSLKRGLDDAGLQIVADRLSRGTVGWRCCRRPQQPRGGCVHASSRDSADANSACARGRIRRAIPYPVLSGPVLL